MNSKGHYINGKWQQVGGGSFTSTSPASGETLWEGREAAAALRVQAGDKVRVVF